MGALAGGADRVTLVDLADDDEDQRAGEGESDGRYDGEPEHEPRLAVRAPLASGSLDRPSPQVDAHSAPYVVSSGVTTSSSWECRSPAARGRPGCRSSPW